MQRTATSSDCEPVTSTNGICRSRAQNLQRGESVELRQRIIRQDYIGSLGVELAQKVIFGFDTTRFETEFGLSQLVLNEIGVRRDVLDDEDIQVV